MLALRSRIARSSPSCCFSVAVFGFVEALPGSIVDTLVGTEGGDIEETREFLERSTPRSASLCPLRGSLYHAARFDFGNSLVTRRPISTKLLAASRPRSTWPRSGSCSPC